MDSWEDVTRWRRAQRERIIEARRALPLETRIKLAESIVEQIGSYAALREPCRVGFYWPIRGEPDLRPFVRDLIGRGFEAALPVVVEKNSPIEFHRWTPESKMTRQSVWGIPVPAEPVQMTPDVVLVPLVGVDEEGYRLGYGGGYYDRTLASLDPRPFAIGVGYELGRLRTIHPQPHDIPMNVTVTEERFFERSPRTRGRSVP